jgi:hypothetical protein
MVEQVSKFNIHYSKINTLELNPLVESFEHSLEDYDNNYNVFKMTELQNYNPIYNDFFELNENNYNKIALNHKYHFYNLNTVMDIETNTTVKKPVFIKCGPLLDPIRYMIGKYNIQDDKIRALPTLLSNAENTLPKIVDKNNTAYVDCFFSFLTNKLAEHHDFVHGLEYYGSFLGIQDKYKMNIIDDVDYLKTSNFFNENIGRHFHCSLLNNTTSYTNFGSRGNKNKLNISETSNTSEISVLELELDELVESDIILNGDEEIVYEKTDSVSTVSTTSSSSSSDNNSEINYSSEEEDDDENEETEETEESNSNSESSNEDSEECSSENSEGEELFVYIDNFPVQLICLEKCDGTLDDLFVKNQITQEIGASILFQIVMTLITYQKVFHFTHNDLHTNNIMYINTTEEFVYYKYNSKLYKVPTYGKIYKIIDFGRGIYKFQGKSYCSDSFAAGGDGHTQYNCQPYMNENKPRIDPNYSFDLCRLGCSIYDFIIDDEEDPSEYDEFQKTIDRWCLDDNGKNVLYKKNGEERYPDFKLYKMIARTVHNHIPQEQLQFPLFSQFEVSDKIETDIKIMDIDILPDYTTA